MAERIVRENSDVPALVRWNAGPDQLSLGDGDVHVWAIGLDVAADIREQYAANLAVEERERASRFVFPRDRDRFIAGRGALRSILAKYLGKPAAAVRFQYGPNGKPALEGTDEEQAMAFNLAHSENLGLLAIGRGCELGVDLERVRWLSDFDELVSRFFSSRESAAFQALTRDIKPQAFFNLWTRKEAWLKAIGEGIGYSLNKVEVVFLPGEKPCLLSLPSSSRTSVPEWSLLELAPAEGFIGALALNRTELQLRCWNWHHENVFMDASDHAARGTPTRDSGPSQSRADANALVSTTGVKRPPIAILGVRFDNLTILEAIEKIENMMLSDEPHYGVTANVDFVVQAQSDIELRRIFFDAHLVLCDGTPLLWASKLLGNPLPERVAGADIAPLLIELAAKKGYRLFFLGAAPESLSDAIDNLRRQYPNLVIAGSYSPPFHPLLEMDHAEIRRRVKAAKPDLLFVSLGCPKQEKWVAMNYRELGVPVTIGVGATIDFLAGHVRRAPVWMQRSGLEWVYRLAQEPRRLYRRYGKDIPVFSRGLLTQYLRFPSGRIAPRAAGQRPGHSNVERTARPTEPIPLSGHDTIKISGRFDAEAARTLAPAFDRMLGLSGDCFLELSEVSSIDSSGVAALMSLQRNIRASGRRLVLLAASTAVKEALKWMAVDGFFDVASEVPEAEHLLAARTTEASHSVILDNNSISHTLRWQGEITAANAEAVWKDTEPHLLALGSESGSLPSTDPGNLTIDLSAVRFIDSSGLGLMIRAKKVARQRGARVLFSEPQSAVSNVVRLAKLDGWLFETEAEVNTASPVRHLAGASA